MAITIIQVQSTRAHRSRQIKMLHLSIVTWVWASQMPMVPQDLQIMRKFKLSME